MLLIEQWPLQRLIPYARNPRKNDHAIGAMSAALREFGFRIPVVAKSDGTIVDGHLRLKAAEQLGLDSVPVVLADDLTESQIKAFRLLANRSAEWAEWDDGLLRLELKDLKNEGYELGLTGFDSAELTELLSPPLQPEDDVENFVAQPVADPVTQRGDIWLLDQHRLLCGDATNAADVERLLDGQSPTLMVTDPPYGVEYDPEWRHRAGVNKSKRIGKVSNDSVVDWRDAWKLFRGDVAYVWHAAIHTSAVAESLKVCDFDIRSQIIWSKPRFALGRGHYHWQHEPCWYAVRNGGNGNWQGARDQSTVWTIGTVGQEDQATHHSTQKPVEAMRRPIKNNSAVGEIVYDPFCGSGSTLMAAETSLRFCYALEIDPAYCDLIVQRWEAHTGRQARRFGAIA